MARKSPLGKDKGERPSSQRTTVTDFLRAQMPRISDHELVRLIGGGSYGEVWLAKNLLGSYRAVKVVHRKAFASQLPYEREYAGLKRFEPISRKHSGWVPILQVGQVGQGVQDAYFYYVMEVADDVKTGQDIDPDTYQPKTLSSELRARGRLTLEESLQLGLSIVKALEALHSSGLIHRDVKPSNIIFIDQVPKLADIGLVTTEEEATGPEGTRGYMPHEQLSCPSADLYSLGKVLYVAATGKDVSQFPELPTDLDRIAEVDRLLQLNEILLEACQDDRDVAKRFQTAGAMRKRLILLLPEDARVISKEGPACSPAVAEDPSRCLETEGGAVPLGSKFYLKRPADDEFRAAITRGDSIIRLKGARQMGKSSLLARGLEQAREQGFAVVATDLQALNDSEFESLEKFYLALANSLADPGQLKLDVFPGDAWDSRCSPNTNFDRYIRCEVLGKLNVNMFWGLDEVDRLFTRPFCEEVFRMLRSWHNKRALDPKGPWTRLTLALVHATEASLFITDLNTSPFNVGSCIELDDFNRDQVADLNRRYGNPLATEVEIGRLIRLVRGQPFLVRRSLSYLVTHKITLAEFEASADRDDGVFADHLRRLLEALNRDKSLMETVRQVLRGQHSIDVANFYRLRSAGLLAGEPEKAACLRCQLYANFFQRHLL